MLLLVLLSVVCQAEPWTERFIIELEQKAVFPNLSVSIERDWHTLPDNLSEVFDTNDYAGLDFRSDDKPNRPGSYGVRLPVEVVVAAGWLLESNLTNDFMLFNPIQQQEATSTQTQGDQPFATITMMLRSVDDQQSHQPSESSSQQAPGVPHLQAISLTFSILTMAAVTEVLNKLCTPWVSIVSSLPVVAFAVSDHHPVAENPLNGR